MVIVALAWFANEPISMMAATFQSDINHQFKLGEPQQKIKHCRWRSCYTLLEVFISLGRWNNRILPRFDIWIELKPCQTMTRGHCGHNFRFLSSAMQRKMSPHWPNSTATSRLNSYFYIEKWTFKIMCEVCYRAKRDKKEATWF